MNQDHPEDGTITFSSVENLAAERGQKSESDRRVAGQRIAQERLLFYAQDEYKWRPNLTLNLGVRYTIFGLFDEKNGLAEPFDFATCGPQGYCPVGSSFGQQNYGDVDPRLGFRLDAQKERKDGDPRRIRHLPRRRTVGRSESARRKRSALLFGKQLQVNALLLPAHNVPDPGRSGPDRRGANAFSARAQPTSRVPNNGTAKTRMLSSGASRCSGSCRRTSWARSPTWEATACICWSKARQTCWRTTRPRARMVRRRNIPSVPGTRMRLPAVALPAFSGAARSA
jgi:hypothetical protein